MAINVKIKISEAVGIGELSAHIKSMTQSGFPPSIKAFYADIFRVIESKSIVCDEESEEEE